MLFPTGEEGGGASKIHPGFPAGNLSASVDFNVRRQSQNVAAGFCTAANGSLRRIGLRITEKHPRGSNRATPHSGPGNSGNCCTLQREPTSREMPAGLSATIKTALEGKWTSTRIQVRSNYQAQVGGGGLTKNTDAAMLHVGVGRLAAVCDSTFLLPSVQRWRPDSPSGATLSVKAQRECKNNRRSRSLPLLGHRDGVSAFVTTGYVKKSHNGERHPRRAASHTSFLGESKTLAAYFYWILQILLSVDNRIYLWDWNPSPGWGGNHSVLFCLRLYPLPLLQSVLSVLKLPERRINSLQSSAVGCDFRVGVMMKLNLRSFSDLYRFPTDSSGSWHIWSLSDLIMDSSTDAACLET